MDTLGTSSSFSININNNNIFNNFITNTNNTECNDEKNVCAICTFKNCNNSNKFICYECLYNYHLSHDKKCLPIKEFNIENYQNYFHSFIEKIRETTIKQVNEIYSFIDKLEEKKYKNIIELIKINNLDLTFELPLEVNIFDKLKISIWLKMKKLINDTFSIIQSQIFDEGIRLNLFYKSFDKLLFNSNLDEREQNYKFKSSTNFILKGLGITSIKNKHIKIQIKNENKILNNEKFDLINSENLTPIIFKNPICINANYTYTIYLNGVYGFPFLKNEKINDKGNIKFISFPENPILSFLLIEDNLNLK